MTSLLNEFKIGDRCYVFDWYFEIYDYENVMYNNYLSGIKDGIVTHTEPFLKIKLLNTNDSHRYAQTYFTDSDIKKTLVHRNKFLKDLDVGRYDRIKIDNILNDASINTKDYCDVNGCTHKSWILSKNEIENQICCVTHYSCDIEKCKYRKKQYLITFTPIDEFEYCRDNGCVSDNVENRAYHKKICSNVFNKYVGIHKKNTAMFIYV